jgi:murein biosynthesis integral membrane protein MurJ
VDKGQISRHTAVVLFANFASLVFGLLATVAVAHYFGSGRTVDAFFIALSVPQIAGQILLSVALVAIVPVYTRYRNEHGLAGAQQRIAPVFYASAIGLCLLSLAVALWAPLLIRILAPGFDAAATREGAALLRWLSPLVVLLGLSGVLQGIQNANHAFVRPAWAKPLPTALALVALVLFGRRFGIATYAWGMLLGAALGLAWQGAEVTASGSFTPRLAGLGAAMQHLRTGFAAIFGARLLGQAGVLISGVVASTIAVGAVSTLGYALKIVSVPFLAASSFGVVLFPAQAQAAAATDASRELRLLWRSVRAMALLGLVATIPLVLWAGPLIQFLFERGAFSAADTDAAALALRVYALGIVFVAVNTIVGNAYWARRWFGARLFLEIVAVILLLGLAWGLGELFGIAGLALALVGEFAFLAVAGLVDVQKRTPAPDLRPQLQWLLRMTVAACGVTLLAWFFVPDVADFRGGSLLWRALVLGSGMSMSAFLYLAIGFLLAFPEIDDLAAMLLGRFTARGRALDAEQRELIPARLRARLRRTVTAWIPRRKARPTEGAQIRRILSPAAVAALPGDFRRSVVPPGLYSGGTPDRFEVDLDCAVERALSRTVDLLGSGPVELGRPIEWSKDYVSGYRWPLRHHTQIRAVDFARQIDCKFPWELARCQHWTHLASARRERPRALNEMLAQFHEFTTANPPGTGITYGNAMEVALRATNWLTAFRAAADALTDGDIEHLTVEMHEAGRFIEQHLEGLARGLNTNHYIADLLGLYVISTMLPSLPDASRWYRFAGDELGLELPHQFDADGMHREGSPYYARLVLEFYLFAFILGRRANDPRVGAWAASLEAAVGCMADLLLPDGTLSRMGDEDGGRLFVPPGEPVADARYLLQIGAVLFERADWKAKAGVQARPGLAFWLGAEGMAKYAEIPELPRRAVRRLFNAAGVAAFCRRQTALIISGGRREARFPRGHLHNDLTSFEFFADGVRWLLDPGTFQYTRQPLWRNRFRVTAAHNVIQVEDVEQNRWDERHLFYLSRDAEPLGLSNSGDSVSAGYVMPAGSPFRRVERHFASDADGRIVRIREFVEGSERRVVTLNLNLAREPFTYLKQDLLHFRGPRGDLLLHVPMPDGFTQGVKDGWYSPGFGVRDRCFRFEASGWAQLPLDWSWAFAAVPKGDSIPTWCDLLLRPAVVSSIIPGVE